jgi:hypothetical protein
MTPELSLDTSKPTRVLLSTCFTFVSSLTYSTLMMEATFSSETAVVSTDYTTLHVSEDKTVHNHRCENLQSYIIIMNILKFSLVPRRPSEAVKFSYAISDPRFN